MPRPVDQYVKANGAGPGGALPWRLAYSDSLRPVKETHEYIEVRGRAGSLFNKIIHVINTAARRCYVLVLE